ncbi:MAG: helix-turn-helix domain-containing protein [Bacteroidales bacterium]|nr:helix-turn-helix domain-containing protein [Bacteroidales bacterium]
MLELTQRQMPGRVAGSLLYLAEEVYNTNDMMLDISRQDLAELSGMTKESAIRILKEFKDAGYISLDTQHLTIHDSGNLEKISQNG